jgi:hypothetical protein
MNESPDQRKGRIINAIMREVRNSAIAKNGKMPDANMFFSLAFLSEAELIVICNKSGISI